MQLETKAMIGAALRSRAIKDLNDKYQAVRDRVGLEPLDFEVPMLDSEGKTLLSSCLTVQDQESRECLETLCNLSLIHI